MLSSSMPLVPERKLTFADIAAMGTSSYDISSDTVSKSTKDAVQDKRAFNHDVKPVIVKKAEEVRDSKSKAPVASTKASPWKVTEINTYVGTEETVSNSPTPAESSQKKGIAKKNTSRRPNTGMLSLTYRLILLFILIYYF